MPQAGLSVGTAQHTIILLRGIQEESKDVPCAATQAATAGTVVAVATAAHRTSPQVMQHSLQSSCEHLVDPCIHGTL